MNGEQIKKGYEEAKGQYASLGVDAAKVIEQLDKHLQIGRAHV